MNCCPTPEPGGCAMPSLEEIPELLSQYTQSQIEGEPILSYLQNKLIDSVVDPL